MSRPLIREPDLIKRWESGDLRKAECKSDNQCFSPAMQGKGVYCISREREQAD
jgi:2,4-dienoyl-CoA reductase-like NADH-dependent reductase (Old Yellow Enzyme family)